jgi:Protein of unknown function (DUF2442)
MLAKSTDERTPWQDKVALGQKIVAVSVPTVPLVHLTFADGYEATLDFAPRLKIGKVFTPLRDPEFFKTVHTASNGHALEWLTQEGDEIDFCADSLRMEAEGLWDSLNNKWI